jgi:TonB family protein
MFETLAGSRRSRPAFVLSLAAHALLVALLVVPPLLAVQEPPEPDDRAIRDWLPPAHVTIADGRREEKPVLLRKGNRENQGGPRRAGASARAAPAQPFERKNENEAPPMTQPQGIPQVVPDAPDGPFIPFEAPGEQSEPGGSVGSTGAGGSGAGVSDAGCEGCPRGPIVIGPDVVPPVPLLTPEPQYPEAARRARLSGWVVVEAIIGVDGKVRDVRVLRSSSLLFQAAAIEAVHRWQYRAAQIGTRAVSVYLTVNVTFTLHS